MREAVAVEPCPGCSEGWRSIHEPYCDACYEGKLSRLRDWIEPMTQVLKFLDSIEGHGYGGMASFEIARVGAQEMIVALEENTSTLINDAVGIAPTREDK